MAKGALLCISCKSKLFLWGKTSSGKKRWYCKNCKISRVYHKRRRVDLFPLFREYVLWGHTYEQIASTSGFSVKHLNNWFHKYLNLFPPYMPRFKQDEFDETFLLMDGLWFSKWYVLMAYRQSKSLYLMHISVAGRETGSKITRDLKTVKEIGYKFTGVVSDGGTGIISAVNEVYPHIPHQICLAHAHRRILASLGKFPRDERVKELKNLADHIWLIESKEALFWWKEKLQNWINTNHSFLFEYRRDDKGNWWFIHKGVRKAVRVLVSLPQSSFKFLDHPLMPKTTNEIEAQFGHLGKRWLAHRGLKRKRWEAFMRWFVYFYNCEKVTHNKRKKD